MGYPHGAQAHGLHPVWRALHWQRGRRCGRGGTRTFAVVHAVHEIKNNDSDESVRFGLVGSNAQMVMGYISLWTQDRGLPTQLAAIATGPKTVMSKSSWKGSEWQRKALQLKSAQDAPTAEPAAEPPPKRARCLDSVVSFPSSTSSAAASHSARASAPLR